MTATDAIVVAVLVMLAGCVAAVIVGAQACHALPSTNADKRRAVEIALKEFPKLSSREIAKVCAVGDDLVLAVRKLQVPDSGTSQKITGADGKSYPAKKPTKKPVAPEPAAPVRYDCFGRRDLRTLPIGEVPPAVATAAACRKSRRIHTSRPGSGGEVSDQPSSKTEGWGPEEAPALMMAT